MPQQGQIVKRHHPFCPGRHSDGESGRGMKQPSPGSPDESRGLKVSPHEFAEGSLERTLRLGVSKIVHRPGQRRPSAASGPDLLQAMQKAAHVAGHAGLGHVNRVCVNDRVHGPSLTGCGWRGRANAAINGKTEPHSAREHHQIEIELAVKIRKNSSRALK